jgi:hypothetical protein
MLPPTTLPVKHRGSPAWAVETIQYIRHWQLWYTDCVGTLYLYLAFRRQARQMYKYMYIYSLFYFIVIHKSVLLYIYNNISPQKTKLCWPYFHFTSAVEAISFRLLYYHCDRCSFTYAICSNLIG